MKKCPLCGSKQKDLEWLEFHLDSFHSRQELMDYIIESIGLVENVKKET